MQKLVKLIGAISLAIAMLASQSMVANAATVVGRISGGGTSTMTDLPAGMGVTSFAIHATLFADHTAQGRVDCVDHVGDVPGYPGNIFGEITGWSGNLTNGPLTLQITGGKLVSIPGGLVVPGGLSFTVTIQQFGGAGIGHWTLDVPGLRSPFNGGPICQELLDSGQIRWN